MEAPSIRKSVMVTGVQIGVSLLVASIIVLFGTFPVTAAETKDVAKEAPLFSCKGRSSGYYADVETGCQKYYMCDASGRLYSYTCPNRTLFQQRVMICDHWFMVDCSLSENYFGSNLHIGAKGKPFLEGNEEAYRLTPEKTSFNRQKTTPYRRYEAGTTPSRRHDEANISPYRRYLATSTTTRRYDHSATSARRQEHSTSTHRPYVASASTNRPYVASTSTNRPYVARTTTTTRPYSASTTTTRPYVASTTTIRPHVASVTTIRPYIASTTTIRPYIASTTTVRPYIASTTTIRSYIASISTNRPYVTSKTTTLRYETSTTPYPWKQLSPKTTEIVFTKNVNANKSQFTYVNPSSQTLPQTRDDGKYFNNDRPQSWDDGKYRSSYDKQENDQFSNPSVKVVGAGSTLPKAFANNPFFNSFTSTSEAPLLITNKGQTYLLTSPIPFRKDHQNVFDKNQPAFNNTVRPTSTSITTTLRTTTAASPLSNTYYNVANTFSTPRREEEKLRHTLPNNQFTRTTEAPSTSGYNFVVAPQGQISQLHKDSSVLRNIFSSKFTNGELSSESPLTTEKEFLATQVRLHADKAIVKIAGAEDLGVDGSHDHVEEEEDLLTNTVEVRIPDTRHMFYIPDNPSRQAEMLSINNETVLTISLPSTPLKHHGAMRFKGSRNSKGVRDDCPQCHPAFLLPGKCQPCVLIR